MPTAKEQLQKALRENNAGAINKALDRIREEKRAADEPAKSKGIPLPPPPVCATIAPSPDWKRRRIFPLPAL